MDIQTYLKQHRITRSDRVVLKDFRKEAFDLKGITAVIYEDSDYYYLRMSIPFDYNEKGVYAIEWGEWLKNISAMGTTAFGVELLVQVSKGGTANILKNNPLKPFIHPDYPKLPIMAMPGQLNLNI